MSSQRGVAAVYLVEYRKEQCVCALLRASSRGNSQAE
jgi:hypothetical protein